MLWWPKLVIPSSKGRTEWNTSTLDHGLRFIAGPEPEMETLNNGSSDAHWASNSHQYEGDHLRELHIL